jgi:hypothetical protein
MATLDMRPAIIPVVGFSEERLVHHLGFEIRGSGEVANGATDAGVEWMELLHPFKEESLNMCISDRLPLEKRQSS